MGSAVVRAAPQPRLDQLTGKQKAAIVLMALGPETAASITQKMSQDELEEITFEIARCEHVPAELARAVIEEWEQLETAAYSIAEGGVDYARRVLEQALGPQKAAVIIKRIETQLRDNSGFHNLRNADPQQIGTLLRNEHPQTIALLLAHLETAQAAAVVKELPTNIGGDVLTRMARMDKVLPEVLQVLERSYGSEAKLTLSHDLAVAGGPESVAEVLNLVTGSIEKDLLDSIAQHDAELCEQIKNLMFVFEDLVKLDDRTLQRVLREVQTRELAVSLKAASQALKERVFASLSKRAADALREEMEMLGPVRVKDVEAAQSAVVASVRALEEAGEIVINGGGDDMVE